MYYSVLVAYNPLWNVYDMMIMYVGPSIMNWWMKWKMNYNMLTTTSTTKKNVKKLHVIVRFVTNAGGGDVNDVKNNGIVQVCALNLDVDRLNVNGEMKKKWGTQEG